jgi:hypothetical protein
VTVDAPALSARVRASAVEGARRQTRAIGRQSADSRANSLVRGVQRLYNADVLALSSTLARVRVAVESRAHERRAVTPTGVHPLARVAPVSSRRAHGSKARDC